MQRITNIAFKNNSNLESLTFQVATAVIPTKQPPKPESTISPGAGAVSSPNK